MLYDQDSDDKPKGLNDIYEALHSHCIGKRSSEETLIRVLRLALLDAYLMGRTEMREDMTKLVRLNQSNRKKDGNRRRM